MARGSQSSRAMRAAAFLLLFTACVSNVDGDSDDNGLDVDTEVDPGWTSVGYGVEYQQVNAGSAFLIAYGGYSAKISYSSAWANQLVDAILGGSDVGRVYAVQGPRDPGYDAKEIGNSKLRAHLKTIDDGTSPIYIVAHSSGTYVAHELLDQLYNAGQMNVLSRISYANLDGGGTGLDDDIIASLGAVTFAYAHDPTLSSGYSENHESAISLGEDYAPKATTYEVTVPDTGCDSGYGWCLHDVLVTHRPHDPTFYDLADDYTDFKNRPVTTEYLDQFLSQK